MKKDIFFLVSHELYWPKRYQAAQEILGSDIKVIVNNSSILEGFKSANGCANTDLFVLIDGDNYLYPLAREEIFQTLEPTLFCTRNKYNISYGHGGIKIIRRTTNWNFKFYSDVTAKLNLKMSNKVLSFHDFGFSRKNEWITIFKEVVKLYLQGSEATLSAWLKFPLPQKILNFSLQYIQSCDLSSLQQSLISRHLQEDLYEKYCYQYNLQK